MSCTTSTDKLIKKLRELLKRASGIQSRAVPINRYYYLEVIAELEVLGERLVELAAQKEKLQQLLEIKHAEVFSRWREDARVVSQHTETQKDFPL